MVSTRPKVSPSSRRKYTGLLAEPICEPVVGLLRVPWRPGAKSRIVEQITDRLLALFDWYKIERNAPNRWTLLAMKLAFEHVPGMEVICEPTLTRGRKKSWQAGQGIELVREVDTLQRQKRIGYAEAIKLLRKQPKWKTFSQQNLVTRHRDARRAERKLRDLVADNKFFGLLQTSVDVETSLKETQ
jgi:hypothetical protein